MRAFYTTAEAAKMLGVTPPRVRQMVLDGTMPAEKHGRDLLILPEAIKRAKLRKTKPGPAASTTTDALDDGARRAAGAKGNPAKPTRKGSSKKGVKKSQEDIMNRPVIRRTLLLVLPALFLVYYFAGPPAWNGRDFFGGLAVGLIAGGLVVELSSWYGSRGTGK